MRGSMGASLLESIKITVLPRGTIERLSNSGQAWFISSLMRLLQWEKVFRGRNTPLYCHLLCLGRGGQDFKNYNFMSAIFLVLWLEFPHSFSPPTVLRRKPMNQFDRISIKKIVSFNRY
jgi:hypothetical protein